jgi:hypothetical protein
VRQGYSRLKTQYEANELSTMIVVRIGESIREEVCDRLAGGIAKLHRTISALVKWDLSIMALLLSDFIQGT